MVDDAKPVRAALYARVSTARDQDPQLQLDDLRRAAQQRGWVVVDEYVDIGQSGSRDRRPALNRLTADINHGKVDRVVCWKFDRFARSVRHLVTALDEFRARGVDFVSLHDGIDTSTPAGRFTFHVIAAVAELERELIRERTRAGLAAARRRGAAIGRPRIDVDVGEVRRLQQRGRPVAQIAKRLGCSESTIRRALRADRESDVGDGQNRPRHLFLAPYEVTGEMGRHRLPAGRSQPFGFDSTYHLGSRTS